LLSPQAEGISLENLVRLGKPMMHPNEFLEIMHNTINHTQVRRGRVRAGQEKPSAV
jgi:hypothetical protein